MNMRERVYWRELLDTIIHIRGERERIAVDWKPGEGGARANA